MTDVDDYRDPRDDYEPSEPDFDAIAEEEHFRQVHPGGGPCDCPVPTPEEQAAQWEAETRAHSEAYHGGGLCNCEAPF